MKAMQFHSEYGQDRFVAELLPDRQGGVFVEVGALDGLLHSNSLYFERERQWIGLLIEPIPELAAACVRNRPGSHIIAAAISDHAGVEAFRWINSGLAGWSGLVASTEPEHQERIAAAGSTATIVAVPVMPLEDALDLAALHRIDYLSIDVEGAEPRILRDFPFGKFDIDIIGVENNWQRLEAASILGKAGYRMIARIGVDDFYRRSAD